VSNPNPATDDRPAFTRGDYVAKAGGDYEFAGRVVSAWRKFQRDDFDQPEPTGPWRYNVQNREGLVHIFNGSQLRRTEKP
jgi:hypothetical protein